MLEKLEILLGFHEEDITPELEEKLGLILESVQARLKNLLGGMEIPGSMEYIVIEVAISRFTGLDQKICLLTLLQVNLLLIQRTTLPHIWTKYRPF